jgi:hypothetical protein
MHCQVSLRRPMPAFIRAVKAARNITAHRINSVMFTPSLRGTGTARPAVLFSQLLSR